jgi:hypothetical protein
MHAPLNAYMLAPTHDTLSAPSYRGREVCIQEELGLDLGRGTGYTDWGSFYFPQSPKANAEVVQRIGTTVSFQILSSIIQQSSYHPTLHGLDTKCRYTPPRKDHIALRWILQTAHPRRGILCYGSARLCGRSVLLFPCVRALKESK